MHPNRTTSREESVLPIVVLSLTHFFGKANTFLLFFSIYSLRIQFKNVSEVGLVQFLCGCFN